MMTPREMASMYLDAYKEADGGKDDPSGKTASDEPSKKASLSERAKDLVRKCRGGMASKESTCPKCGKVGSACVCK